MSLFKRTAPVQAKPQDQKPHHVSGDAQRAVVGVAPRRAVDVVSRHAIPISFIPHLSEKAQRLKDAENAYVFRIPPGVTKVQVAREIHAVYHVAVKGVRIVNLPRKLKRMGKYSGYRSGVRKAIVSLKAGDKIDLA